MATRTPAEVRERAKHILDAMPPWPAAAIPSPFTLDVPLRVEAETGRVRFVDSRIPIDTVVHAYNRGEPPAAIAVNYPTLSEQAIHAFIAYYLRHKEQVDAYLRAWDEHANAVQEIVESDPAQKAFRETLLERRKAANEQ